MNKIELEILAWVNSPGRKYRKDFTSELFDVEKNKDIADSIFLDLKKNHYLTFLLLDTDEIAITNKGIAALK